MKEIQYVGEHLAIGNWGKFSVYLALAAAIFSAIAYFLSFKQKDSVDGNSDFFRRMGRAAFWVHSFAVASIFITLFVIIQRHYFEYQYAWQHSSRELPIKYMVSCFWEGQEGSFLLWMVWHAVIGNILIFTSKSWESPVMTVIALAQLMLATMLLGVDLFGFKLGSNPFELLRNKMEAPIFSNPEYLSKIADGNGLNPLLQNYWMVIHPPTLFFGFAATIVPFAYAIAALWTKRYTDWVKPALPWALVGVMILGTGIIMGGFWAYESLTFGGYWAWDPVENASLIPWLILIAAVHLMLINKSTGNALYSTYIFTIIAFILVLYATFLTRSGILGETSVHAFTDLGMSGQLLVFLFMFFWLPAYITIKDTPSRFGFLGATIIVFVTVFIISDIAPEFPYKWIVAPFVLFTAFLFFRNLYVVNPIKGKEEHLASREFWMFIGSLVFIVSGIQVLGTTSLPVFNKLGVPQLINGILNPIIDLINSIFGTEVKQLTKNIFAPPDNVIETYNSWQLPIAVIIALLTGATQFFKYKKTEARKFYIDFMKTFLPAIGITVGCMIWFNITYWVYVIFLLASLYAIIGNVAYIFTALKGKIKAAGASVAHIGFGILLVGVLVSSANKNVVSINTSGAEIMKDMGDKNNREHILLWKDLPTQMDNYLVTYLGDSVAPPNNFYKINYKRLNRKTGQLTGDEFTLYPNAQKNPKMGLISNPDTRHYVSHDVFTYVSSVPDKEANESEPYTQVKTDTLAIGDTLFGDNARVIFENVRNIENKAAYNFADADLLVAADLKVYSLFDTVMVEPLYAYQGNSQFSTDAILNEAGLKIRFTGLKIDTVHPENTRFIFEVAERPPFKDYVVLKAVVFPYINFVWAGTIIMVIGFLMSIVRRVREYRREGKRAISKAV